MRRKGYYTRFRGELQAVGGDPYSSIFVTPGVLASTSPSRF